MHRSMYLSYLKPDITEEQLQKLVEKIESSANRWKADGFYSISFFQLDDALCVYLESEDALGGGFDWAKEAADYVECWPSEDGPRWSVRMPDVFHDGVPRDYSSWRGDRKPASREGALARLKPEMLSSYVFYHYQLQEEKPEHFNKTYTIGLHGTLLFSYSENPGTVSETKPQGKLSTNYSPKNWHEVMGPHFEWWPEDVSWRPMRHLLTVEI